MFHAQEREAETTSLTQLNLVWVFDLYVMLRTWVEKQWSSQIIITEYILVQSKNTSLNSDRGSGLRSQLIKFRFHVCQL